MLASNVRSEDVLSWSLYFLAVLLVGVGGLIWAAFLRKAKKRRKRIHRPHTWQMETDEERTARRARRSSRRRTKHKEPGINPTLASTGGLPPVRPEDPPEPPPQAG
jgi:Flp pilus assembly protein TadB